MERVFYYISNDKLTNILEQSNWELDKAMNACHIENGTAQESLSKQSIDEAKSRKTSIFNDILGFKNKKDKETIPELIRLITRN